MKADACQGLTRQLLLLPMASSRFRETLLKKKILVQGSEEVAKQLNALTALAEDLGSVPCTHVVVQSNV